jgi:hypothetical protein
MSVYSTAGFAVVVGSSLCAALDEPPSPLHAATTPTEAASVTHITNHRLAVVMEVDCSERLTSAASQASPRRGAARTTA